VLRLFFLYLFFVRYHVEQHCKSEASDKMGIFAADLDRASHSALWANRLYLGSLFRCIDDLVVTDPCRLLHYVLPRHGRLRP
jgi:hypothetical protein